MKKWLCVLVLMGVVFSVNAQIDENPVDPDANKETRELYRYLRNEIWGKKVLSGCQHQALPSLGFSRQEHWSGLPFPSPMHESEK